MTLVCNAKIEISSLTGHCTVVLHRYVAAHTRVKLGLKNHPHVLLFDAHAWHAKEMSTACKKWEIDGNSCMWAVPQTHLLEWNLSFYYNYGQLLKKIIHRYWIPFGLHFLHIPVKDHYDYNRCYYQRWASGSERVKVLLHNPVIHLIFARSSSILVCGPLGK